MKYLITGGAGFVGTRLVRRLVDAGHELVVIDNQFLGRLSNLNGVIHKIDFRSSFAGNLFGFDGIIHLGMPSSTGMYRDEPFLASNVIGEFLGIMDVARHSNCKVVFASTSSLYNKNIPPFKEDMYIYPTDLYTEVRFTMERWGEVFNQLFGVKNIGLRFFSIYGENEHHKGKYANIISQMMWSKEKGETFEIYGDGSTTRDFIYVEDVLDAIMLALNSDVDCGIFNVGTGKLYSMKEIAEMIGADVKYVPNPLKNYVDKTLADITLAEQKLGFKAKKTVEEYIEKWKQERR